MSTTSQQGQLQAAGWARFSTQNKNKKSVVQELESCLWIGSTCVIKLHTMYLTRSALSRPGVFLLVTNLLVTIWKARPHGSFSTSPIKFFQHWSQVFFMPCLKADFAFFHASRSRESPFGRVNLRCAVMHFRRRTDNWSFYQYIESPRRGMKWSHAATTFRIAARTVSSYDPADLAQPSLSMSLVSSRCSRSLFFFYELDLNFSTKLQEINLNVDKDLWSHNVTYWNLYCW